MLTFLESVIRNDSPLGNVIIGKQGLSPICVTFCPNGHTASEQWSTGHWQASVITNSGMGEYHYKPMQSHYGLLGFS